MWSNLGFLRHAFSLVIECAIEIAVDEWISMFSLGEEIHLPTGRCQSFVPMECRT
jgi:hypothetical protein